MCAPGVAWRAIFLKRILNLRNSAHKACVCAVDAIAGLRPACRLADMRWLWPCWARNCTRPAAGCLSFHTKNKFVGRIIPFLVLGFWDKNTGICAGAMPYRRDFPTTTRLQAFEAEKGVILPTMLVLRGYWHAGGCPPLDYRGTWQHNVCKAAAPHPSSHPTLHPPSPHKHTRDLPWSSSRVV